MCEPGMHQGHGHGHGHGSQTTARAAQGLRALTAWCVMHREWGTGRGRYSSDADVCGYTSRPMHGTKELQVLTSMAMAVRCL